jgi:hypothetical protein
VKISSISTVQRPTPRSAVSRSTSASSDSRAALRAERDVADRRDLRPREAAAAQHGRVGGQQPLRRGERLAGVQGQHPAQDRLGRAPVQLLVRDRADQRLVRLAPALHDDPAWPDPPDQRGQRRVAAAQMPPRRIPPGALRRRDSFVRNRVGAHVRHRRRPGDAGVPSVSARRALRRAS